MDRPPNDPATTRFALVLMVALVIVVFAILGSSSSDSRPPASRSIAAAPTGEVPHAPVAEPEPPHTSTETSASAPEPAQEVSAPSADSNVNDIATKCNCTPEQVERVIAVAKEQLVREGIYQNDADLARHINEAVPADVKVRLPEVAALYVASATAEHKGYGLR